ncbi:hypothetical protein N7465_001289 [Penicillium sp. CMV-2018d]|nr:hypothetical protein N7465_001289 [Penicillium sp. CMV-2018d]
MSPSPQQSRTHTNHHRPTPQPQRNTGPYQLYRPNGAPSIYAHGTDTPVSTTNSWLYSSGPVSNGLYTSGNGTIVAHNGGPLFPRQVLVCVAHSAGIGSATYYAFETIEAYNVLSDSEHGPVVYSLADHAGLQSLLPEVPVRVTESDLTGDLVAYNVSYGFDWLNA